LVIGSRHSIRQREPKVSTSQKERDITKKMKEIFGILVTKEVQRNSQISFLEI
jgi:hypothetical protein